MALATFMDCAQILSNINACHDFFIWTTSGIRTALCNSNDAHLPGQVEIEKLDTKLGQLKNQLWKLKTTMPKMLDLIDRAEWQTHIQEAADLLPHIKDAVYDAEDLLDEFDYYALKLKVEWSKSSEHDNLRGTFLEFFDSVGSNDYIREVSEIQAKLDHVHRQSKRTSWYQALQQKLKRCFSICAMYPKDYKFEKDFLADIWVAQGYVADPQEASLCFDALANRSFFQKASPHSDKYVIHDLMHDTAQLVSKDECFTIKYESDIDKVPSNVRHLSIFANGNIECAKLKGICQKKKLRSLVCDESYTNTRDFAPLIDCWFKELCLLGGSKFGTLPSSVSRLHHLKIIERVSSEFENIPPGFSDAISLQKIKSKSFSYKKDRSEKLCLEWSVREPSQEMMENQMEHIPHSDLRHLELKKFGGECFPSWFRPNILPRLCSLEFDSCDKFKSMPFFGLLEGSLDNAAGSEILNCPGESGNLNHPQESVQGFSALTRIKIYRCSSLTSILLHVCNLPSLEELDISYCHSLASIGVCGASSSSSGSSGVKGLSSLGEINISDCDKLLSIDELLTPDHLPVVKTVSVARCDELTSLSVDRLDGLQDLRIVACGKLRSERVMTFPSSLKKFSLSMCEVIESININNSESRTSSELEELWISMCPSLKSIGGATATDNLKHVNIIGCPEL